MFQAAGHHGNGWSRQQAFYSLMRSPASVNMQRQIVTLQMTQMFTVTRLLGLALCVLATAMQSLFAQGTTYEVQLATTTFVNRTLEADCSAEMIYRNLLAGNFDVDGDGLIPPESAFIIEIDDNNPANGRTLDGCGSFNFRITPAPDGGVIGFTGGSGVINASDITPPTVRFTPAANGPFLTTQLSELTINNLPFTVSRTFVIDGETGFPLMNSLDPALMMRLLAGGDIPRFEDACSDIEVTVADEVNISGDCAPITITRTFTARDFSAACSVEQTENTTTVASYDILLERPTLDLVVCPPRVVDVNCNAPVPTSGTFPAPTLADFPFVNTSNGPVALTAIFGNVGATFVDGEAIQVCANTYKFVRTWTIIDWCEPERVRTCTQLVKVGDTAPPTVTLPVQDLDFDGIPDQGPLVFSTNAPGCGAFISVNSGNLAVSDACGEVVAVEAFVLLEGREVNLVGPINALAATPGDRLTPFLPAGEHTIRYVVADACGNTVTESLEISIQDRSGPVVIAEDALNIALSDAGFAEVTATDLDEGSYDDCTEVTLEVAFANPSSMMAIGNFAPSITLSCIDVGVVPVILRVTDENGNANQHMSVLNVVDNSAPVCIAPGAMSIDCIAADGMLPEDLDVEFAADPAGTIALLNSLFGQPTSLDNCGNEQVTQTVADNRNDCGQGTIERTFSVMDARGFVSTSGCQQTVAISGVRQYTIEWPADVATDCGDTPSFNEVTADITGCDLLVTTVETDTFTASSLACLRLRRTIEVFNFCEYNGIDEAYNVPRDADQDGNFLEPTFLHIVPGFSPGPADDVALLDMDNNPNNNNTIRPLDIDDFSGVNGDSDADGDTGYGTSLRRGYFRYVQFVSIIDNDAPDVDEVVTTIADGVNCNGGSITVNYAVTDACAMTRVSSTALLDLNFNSATGFNPDRGVSSSELQTDGSGNFTLRLADLPAGNHALRLLGSDECGNRDGELVPFTIGDNAGVSPICIGALTFVLMPDGEGGGMAMVEADDYIIDVNGNCGGAEVRLAVYREEGEADQPGFVPQPGRDNFPVTCDDIGSVSVRVYTFSANGSFNFCSAVAEIDPLNDNVCPDGGLGSLAGFITTPRNQHLSAVEIHLSDRSQMNDMQYTDENGSFLFAGLSEGSSYEIRPAMAGGVNLQRVKTSDISRIMNHVMGTNPITNPHLLLAGDVDADGYLTVGDMVAIRRVILGLDDTFREGPTFRFIQRDFDLAGLTEGWDPEMFPATYTVEPLQGHNREADFIAIEIGDVYLDAAGRSTETLFAEDKTLQAGEQYTLTITANALAGLQGTIEASADLRLLSWTSAKLQAGHVNDQWLADGLLAFSYNAPEIIAGTEILTLQVEARRALRVRDHLRLGDRIVATEGVTTSGNAMPLALQFTALPQTEAFQLYQNYPNPIVTETTVAFTLPEAMPVTLEIHDLQGRILTTRHQEATAGRNTVTFHAASDFPQATGILTCTLRAGKEQRTIRMTVVAR